MSDDSRPSNRPVSSEHYSDAAAGRDVELTPSVAFDALSDRHSRFVLYLLEDRGGTIPVDELAARFAAWVTEMETATGRVPDDVEEEIYLRLHHVALPKLVDLELVTYDRDSGAVTLSVRYDRLRAYLEFARVQECGDVESFLEGSRRDLE